MTIRVSLIQQYGRRRPNVRPNVSVAEALWLLTEGELGWQPNRVMVEGDRDYLMIDVAHFIRWAESSYGYEDEFYDDKLALLSLSLV